MYSETRFRKTALRSAVLLALSINGAALTLNDGAAQANNQACASSVSTGSGNFTMLTSGGYVVGGTNNVSMNWDGSVYTASSDYIGPGSTANVFAASTTPFFGTTVAYTWTAHDIQMFAPGSYTFDTALGGGNGESGTLSVTVGPGQLGMHMLFDWNGNNNIDVFVVANLNSAFGPGIGNSTQKNSSGSFKCGTGAGGTQEIKNCLYDGKDFGTDGKPAGSKVWVLASSDGNSDGIMGVPMAAGGPFANFNANFNFPGTFANPTGACAGFVDITPDAFSFNSTTNAAFSTLYVSNTITVSGLGVNQSPPNSNQTATVTVSGGMYSKNGALPTSAPGTAVNGDTFSVQGTSPGANNQSVDVVLQIGNGSSTYSIFTPVVAGAQGSNFTMIDPGGGAFGGTNDVVATWDSACENSAASTNFSHMSLSSITPFFQNLWTAHHIRVFCPGTYIINTECTTADLDAGTCLPNNVAAKNYTLVVPAGKLGGHMLFDWNNSRNIDVVELWELNAVFGPSPMYTGAGACNNPATTWNLMSSDWDSDGKNGGAMIDGPFAGFSANFNIRTSGTPLTCAAYTPTVNVSDPSGAGGCSISTAPANVTERADWWLIAGFLAWLGGIQMRLKRKAKS